MDKYASPLSENTLIKGLMWFISHPPPPGKHGHVFQSETQEVSTQEHIQHAGTP